ncbi:MAG: hypothetical protein ACKORJ_06290 [Bacteroidota bacterium]
MNNRLVLFLVILFLNGSLAVSAQNMVSYQVVENEPEKLARLSLTFDYLYMNFGKGNVEGSSADYGINGTFRPAEAMEVNGMVHLPLISFQKPAAVLVDANVVLYLSKNRIVKTVPVYLKYQETKGLLTNTITTSSIEVPDANVDNRFGLRGGIYLRRNSYSEIGDPSDRVAAVTQTGVYGGIQLFRTVNLRLKTGDGTAATEGGVIWYADVMILGTSFSDQAVLDYYKLVNGKIAPIGVRVGVMLKPVMPGNSSTRIGFFKSLDMRGEFGVRPVDRFFFNMGVGWNFLRR